MGWPIDSWVSFIDACFLTPTTFILPTVVIVESHPTTVIKSLETTLKHSKSAFIWWAENENLTDAWSLQEETLQVDFWHIFGSHYMREDVFKVAGLHD